MAHETAILALFVIIFMAILGSAIWLILFRPWVKREKRRADSPDPLDREP